ncbi:MAG: hypothetical protein AAB531_02875 [Patescibacteria group bacterium]
MVSQNETANHIDTRETLDKPDFTGNMESGSSFSGGPFKLYILTRRPISSAEIKGEYVEGVFTEEDNRFGLVMLTGVVGNDLQLHRDAIRFIASNTRNDMRIVFWGFLDEETGIYNGNYKKKKNTSDSGKFQLKMSSK